MQDTQNFGALTRRQLLKRTAATGAIALLGPGFIAAPNAAWAMEVTHISAHEMATLLQMARDIYPHDQIADEFYAIAIKGYDSEEQQAMVKAGVALEAGGRYLPDDYVNDEWESFGQLAWTDPRSTSGGWQRTSPDFRPG